MIAVVGFVYSVTSIAGGNGFLAVYLTGIIVGNSNFIHRKSIVKFHDGLAWLMQIAMFLTLGLLVFPSQLVPVIGSGLLISAFLIVVARPVAVFISLCFSKFSLREKAFISWVGLRGAVPIILATYPLVAGVQRADAIFNIVFFIVMTSSIIQGAFLALPAKWLGVDTEMVESAEELPNLFSGEYITNKLLEIKVPDGSKVIGKQIVEIDLPEDFQILLLSRNLKLINPIGRTVIQPGDSLLILADCNSPEKILQLGNIL
jgi:cell volume regulation protein A